MAVLNKFIAFAEHQPDKLAEAATNLSANCSQNPGGAARMRRYDESSEHNCGDD